MAQVRVGWTRYGRVSEYKIDSKYLLNIILIIYVHAKIGAMGVWVGI